MEDRLISCPKDASPMSRVTLGAVRIDRCPACGGVWLDRGELDAIKHTALEDEHRKTLDALDDLGVSEPARRPQPLLCPRDHTRMSVYHDPAQKHIELDTCTKCGGVFFDAGELSDLTEITFGERLRGLLG
jgi:Zn-finger nucleic acid-binding protein